MHCFARSVGQGSGTVVDGAAAVTSDTPAGTGTGTSSGAGAGAGGWAPKEGVNRVIFLDCDGMCRLMYWAHALMGTCLTEPPAPRPAAVLLASHSQLRPAVPPNEHMVVRHAPMPTAHAALVCAGVLCNFRSQTFDYDDGGV